MKKNQESPKSFFPNKILYDKVSESKNSALKNISGHYTFCIPSLKRGYRKLALSRKNRRNKKIGYQKAPNLSNYLVLYVIWYADCNESKIRCIVYTPIIQNGCQKCMICLDKIEICLILCRINFL